MHYHVGWNLTGYLPEMDPYIVGDIETGIKELSDEIEQVVDSLASVVDTLEDEDADCASVKELRDAERLWEELGAVKRSIANGEDDGYAQFGWDGFIRHVHYWVLPCPIDACETDHCAECGQDITAYWRDARGEPTCEECERELFETQDRARHDHTAQDPNDEVYWVDGCRIEHGRCDTCGQPCDESGCTQDRQHTTARV